jgi:hypothetical protein
MNGLFPTNFKRLNFDLSVLFFASVIIVLPIFIWGVPNGSDTTQHYQFALTFFDSIQNGNFYPSWASTTNRGFGDVGIRFYPPVAYYVMVGFRFLSGNWYDASALAFLFWFFLGGVGMYFWCREWFGESASLAAGIVFIFMPYHANQIYNSFMYAEFAATSILPFCFLFVTRIFRADKITDVIGLAFFYSMLVLTHLPLTVIGSISLLIYSLSSLKKENFFSTLLKLSSAVFLGLLASSFYWSRMVTELDFVKHTTKEFTINVYDFHGNFLCPFFNSLLFGVDYGSYEYGDILLLMTAVICLPCVGVFYFWSKEKTDRKLFSVVVLMVFALFISTPLSLGIWENFSALQKVQFPWRWLAIISMTGTVFVAACFDGLVDLYHTKRRPITLLTCGLITVGIIFTFTRLLSAPLQMPRQDFAEQTKYLLNSGSFTCWLPIWAKNEVDRLGQKVRVENRSAQVTDWQPTQREIMFSAGNPTDARIATFYYPHWKATVNGQLTELRLADDGTMLVPLPPEQANVKIWFQEPLQVRLASYLSLFMWLVFGIAGLFFVGKRLISAFSANTKINLETLK